MLDSKLDACMIFVAVTRSALSKLIPAAKLAKMATILFSRLILVATSQEWLLFEEQHPQCMHKLTYIQTRSKYLYSIIMCGTDKL